MLNLIAIFATWLGVPAIYCAVMSFQGKDITNDDDPIRLFSIVFWPFVIAVYLVAAGPFFHWPKLLGEKYRMRKMIKAKEEQMKLPKAELISSERKNPAHDGFMRALDLR